MISSMVIDMNLTENTCGKQNGRKKSNRNESTQKKNKKPQRGMGVEQLERLRLQERWKKMTEITSLYPLPIPSYNPSSCTSLPNSGLQFRPGYPPTMLFPSSVIRFENSKELSSIPNYIKCASDGCGVCHKKIRIHGGTSAGVVNQVREYEFFPGKGGGDGSCLTTVTGNEEGVDLTLKLSY